MTANSPAGDVSSPLPAELIAAAAAEPPNYRRLRDIGQRVLLERLLSDLGLYPSGRPKPGLSEAVDLSDADIVHLIEAPAIAPPGLLMALLQALDASAAIASPAVVWCHEYLTDIAQEREDEEEMPGRLAWHLAPEFAAARTATARVLEHLLDWYEDAAIAEAIGLVRSDYARFCAAPGFLGPSVALAAADCLLSAIEDDGDEWDRVRSDFVAVRHGAETALYGAPRSLLRLLREQDEREEQEHVAAPRPPLLTDEGRQQVIDEVYRRSYLSPAAQRGLPEFAKGLRQMRGRAIPLAESMRLQILAAVALAEADALRPQAVRIGTSWITTPDGAIDDACVAADRLSTDQLRAFLVQRALRHVSDELGRGEPRAPTEALDSWRSQHVAPRADSIGVPTVHSIEDASIPGGNVSDALDDRNAGPATLARLIAQGALHKLWPQLRPSEQRLVVAMKENPTADDRALAHELNCAPATIRSRLRDIRTRLGAPPVP